MNILYQYKIIEFNYNNIVYQIIQIKIIRLLIYYEQ